MDYLLSLIIVLLYFTIMAGRNTVLTEAVKKRLLKAFEHDANVTQACRFAGLKSRTQFYDYCEKDKEFAEECRIAKEWALFEIQMPMMKQAKKNGFLALKILERRKRNQFALKVENENNENVNYQFGFGNKTIHDAKKANQKNLHEEDEKTTMDSLNS